MPITFPTALDTFSNPTGTDLLENAVAALDHDVQHSNANDAIEALEAKVGINSSAVQTSHDFKLSGVATGDKAVSKTGIETLTNKTLTAPQINFGSDATGDMIYRTALGVTARLPAGADGSIISYAGGVPTTIPNPAAADASTTVKGVLEIATVAERQARTATGGTGAKLAITTENLGAWNSAGYAADAGASDAYVITLAIAPSAYFGGMVVQFKANTANTGAATLNVNSLGAVNIVKYLNTTLANNDIVAGMHCTVIYDSVNSVFVLQNPVANVVSLGLIAAGTTTKNAADASTTQNIAHGLGVIPKRVRIIAIPTSSNSAGLPNRSETVYDGATQTSLSLWGLGSNSTTSTAFNISSTTVANGAQSGVVTFDSTNIIITWTQGGTAAGAYSLFWEATA